MALGLIPSTRESIKYLLRRSDGGNCVALVVGGAPESLYSRRYVLSQYSVTLKGGTVVSFLLEN